MPIIEASLSMKVDPEFLILRLPIHTYYRSLGDTSRTPLWYLAQHAPSGGTRNPACILSGLGSCPLTVPYIQVVLVMGPKR